MNLKSEALVTIGSISTVVVAVIVFLKAFGVPITEDQQSAITNLIAVLAPLVVALIGRQFVFAQDTTQAIATKAAQTGIDEVGTPPDGAVKP